MELVEDDLQQGDNTSTAMAYLLARVRADLQHALCEALQVHLQRGGHLLV